MSPLCNDEGFIVFPLLVSPVHIFLILKVSNSHKWILKRTTVADCVSNRVFINLSSIFVKSDFKSVITDSY